MADSTNQQSIAAQACRILGLLGWNAPSSAARVEAPDTYGASTVQKWARIASCTVYASALTQCTCLKWNTYPQMCSTVWMDGDGILSSNSGVPSTMQMAITCPTRERKLDVGESCRMALAPCAVLPNMNLKPRPTCSISCG